MPYIIPERRGDFLLYGTGDRPQTAGELNYILTSVVWEYIQDRGLSYASINDVLGAFSGAEKEFYRRVASPYEDTKIIENGDVYYEEGKEP